VFMDCDRNMSVDADASGTGRGEEKKALVVPDESVSGFPVENSASLLDPFECGIAAECECSKPEPVALVAENGAAGRLMGESASGSSGSGGAAKTDAFETEADRPGELAVDNAGASTSADGVDRAERDDWRVDRREWSGELDEEEPADRSGVVDDMEARRLR
jgi:hypothetical protein